MFISWGGGKTEKKKIINAFEGFRICNRSTKSIQNDAKLIKKLEILSPGCHIGSILQPLGRHLGSSWHSWSPRWPSWQPSCCPKCATWHQHEPRQANFEQHYCQIAQDSPSWSQQPHLKRFFFNFWAILDPQTFKKPSKTCGFSRVFWCAANHLKDNKNDTEIHLKASNLETPMPS